MVLLLVHRHRYPSHRLYGVGNHQFNNTQKEELSCEYVPYLEGGCQCRYSTTITLAYETYRRVSTLPFTVPRCPIVPMIDANEIDVWLETPLRGWSWNENEHERAWITFSSCDRAIHA